MILTRKGGNCFGWGKNSWGVAWVRVSLGRCEYYARCAGALFSLSGQVFLYQLADGFAVGAHAGGL